MMLFSVGAGVGFGVGGFEGAPVVGLLVGLGVGGLEGGPVVGGSLAGIKEYTKYTRRN